MDKKLLGLNGVFSVFKPAGESSAKTVDRVKTGLIRAALGGKAGNHEFKRLSRQVKVGHGGTLDPMATGVLVIGLNGGCKDLSKYLSGSKSYVAEARFGEHYDTLDCTGKLLQTDEKWTEVVGKVPGIIDKFVGEAVMQVPPAFSAIHVNGKRAYELARQESTAAKDEKEAEESVTTETTVETNEESISTVESPQVVKPQKEASFEIPARPVPIHSIIYTPTTLPRFNLTVSCGGGCYIRSIIRDIAAEVGTLATMTKLERTKQGIFTLEMCLSGQEEWGNLDKVEEAISKAKSLL